MSSIRRDTVFNLLGNGIPLIVALITIPALLVALGPTDFGLLSIMWALIGYFGIFDLGIGRALTYEIATAEIRGRREVLPRLMKAGALLTCLAGVLAAILVFGVLAPNGAQWFKTAGSDVATVTEAFQWIALAVIPTTMTSGLRGALEGFKRFLEANVNRTVIGVLMFAAPYWCVQLGHADLPTIAQSLAVARVLVLLLAYWQLRQYFLTGEHPHRSDFVPLIRFGSWITLSATLSPLMVYGDRFVVSAVVGAAAVAAYAIPQEGLQRLLILPMSLAGALMPRVAAKTDRAEIMADYRRNTLRVAIVMLPVCGIAAILAEPFLSWWISPDFAAGSSVVAIILCVGLWFNSIAQIPITFLHAAGNPRAVALVHVAELFGYVLLVYLLASSFGVSGAAWAWTIRVAFDYFLLHLMFRRYGCGLADQG